MESMDQESLTLLSMILWRTLQNRFPEWEPFIETVESGSGDNKRCLDFRIPAPNDAGTSLSLRDRGDCIEVCFSDGRPPGGAERLLIGEPGEEKHLVEAALELVEEITGEKIVIGRDSSWLSRSGLPPSFLSASELPRKKELLKVVSWRGTYDFEASR